MYAIDVLDKSQFESRDARPFVDITQTTGHFGIDVTFGRLMDRLNSSDALQLLLDPFRTHAEHSKLEPLDPKRNLILIDGSTGSPGALHFTADSIFGKLEVKGHPASTPTGVPLSVASGDMATKTAQPAMSALTLPREMTVSHGTLLKEIYDAGPWTWRELADILHTSSSQLIRIVQRQQSASDDVGLRIDDLNRFVMRLKKIAGENVDAMKRLLQAPRDGDGVSARDMLLAQNYRGAVSAVLDAASPRPNVATVENVQLRWYSEPSRPFGSESIDIDGE